MTKKLWYSYMEQAIEFLVQSNSQMGETQNFPQSIPKSHMIQIYH